MVINTYSNSYFRLLSFLAVPSITRTWMPRPLLNYVMAATGTVSGAVELFGSSECNQWRSSLDSYEEVVRLLTSQKKRSKGESLMSLDKW